LVLLALVFVAHRVTAQTVLTPRLSVSYGARLNAVAASEDTFAVSGEPVAGVTSVTIWDAVTGRIARTYNVPSTVVYSLVFSPDGRFLAAGCGDGLVRLWRLPNGQATEWRASDASVLALAFSPDSRTLVSAGGDQEIRLWDANSARLIRSLKGHFASVFSVAFDAEGSRLASGDADGVMLLWEPETATIRAEWRIHQDAISSLAFVPKGNLLVSGGWDGNVFMTNTATGATDTVATAAALVHSVAVSPSGTQLAVSLSDGAKGGTLRFWHLPSRTLLASFDTASNRDVAYVGDGGAVVAGTSTGDVRLWAFTPRTPALLVTDSAKTDTFRWTATDALGYECQVTRVLPFRDTVTPVVVRAAEWRPTEGISDGEIVYWRVRALGFGVVSEWSEARSVRWTRNVARRPSVRVRASEASVKVGDEFDVDVVVEDAVDLAGFGFALVVEPPLLFVTEIHEGDALRADGLTSFWNVPVVSTDSSALRIADIAGARIHATGVNVVKGQLLSVRAKALRAGDVTVRLVNPRFVTGTGQLLDADVYPLRLTVVTTFLAGDVNRDGVVDVSDLVFVAQRFGLRVELSDDGFADVNGDGAVNILDLLLIVRQFGDTTRPSSTAAVSLRLTANESEAWQYVREALERLSASERATPAWESVMRVVRVHAERFGMPRVELEPNYPNPFNPETWIPFRLGERASVAVTVWSVRGDAIRHLELGERDAGSDAVRWDGRSDDGRPCVSGVYVIGIEARSASDGTVAVATRRVLLSK
jgi:WD40 repeat protein